MAHFAEINDNNVVVRVLVVDDLHEADGHNFLSNTLGLGGTWLKTSYNTTAGTHKENGTPFRKNFAAAGYTYDSSRDAFIPPKPFPSWVLNEDTCTWDAPVAIPDTEKRYTWDEDTTSWVELVPPTE